MLWNSAWLKYSVFSGVWSWSSSTNQQIIDEYDECKLCKSRQHHMGPNKSSIEQLRKTTKHRDAWLGRRVQPYVYKIDRLTSANMLVG